MSKVLEAAKKEKARETALWAEAQKVVPKLFHPFILGIEQNKKLTDFEEKSKELEEHGCFAWKGKTYIKQVLPYMAVDGRIAWAQSEGQLDIHSDAVEVMGEYFMKSTVRTARGIATGWSKINFGGSGVDSTNPIENGETSSVGRALGFLAYGVFGGLGIASYDEVLAAIEERDRKSGSGEDKAGSGKTELAKTDKTIPSSSKDAKSGEKPGVEEYTLTSISDPDKSPKGTPYVKVSLATTKGESLNVYAKDKMVDPVLALALGKPVKLKIGTDRGTKVITAIH
ncbi:MAG: hypothetical protein KGZ79_16660 [Dethiobacter sp.]|nr:hypothetical protein [Dethiobacter sp.]